MKPIDLHAQAGADPRLKHGDIVTFEGIWNRPKAFGLDWWGCLWYGRAAAVHGFGSRTKVFLVCRRRDLFRRRELQKYRIVVDAAVERPE